VVIVLGVSFLNSSEFKNFGDCIRQAQSQSERDACADQFNKDLGN
jgi:hypothetical protein